MNILQKTSSALVLGLAFAAGTAPAFAAEPTPSIQIDTKNKNFIIMASDQTLDDLKALAGDKPLIVFAYADWCGYCRAMEPALEAAFAKHYPHQGDALLVFGNVDKVPAIQQLIGPKGGVPNLYSYREGKLIENARGFPSQALKKIGDQTYVSGNILLSVLDGFLTRADKPAPSSKLNGPGF